MKSFFPTFSGKTVLVTGAAGAIGSNLCLRLQQMGARVLAVDDLSASEMWNVPTGERIQFINEDILNESQMLSVFNCRPYIVFHLAAFFANQNSIDDPERDLMVNGMGTLRMLEFSRRFQVERFVYATSSSICSDSTEGLIEEVTQVHLTSPYQITKMLGEQYCTFFSEHYGLGVVKARLFNSYGPGDAPGKYRSVIPNFIYLALKQQPLPITGTGSETRDFTYVGDIVDGLVESAVTHSAIGKELNFCSGIETRISDLAAMINDMTGNTSGVQYTSQRKWDSQKRRRGSYEHAKELVGYEPTVQLGSGLRETIQWMRTNWERIEIMARHRAVN